MSTRSACAWQYDRRGALPTTLKKKQVQLPALQPGEVLVKVHAAALNPVDWKIAALAPGLLNKLPQTAGADFAGEVVSVSPLSQQSDEEPTWLKEGARVYGILANTVRDGRGTLSTFTIAKSAAIAPVPEGMSFVEASGLALTGLTAITLAANVKSNDRVLILGGTTSVGLLLIQMCVAERASRIVATCSAAKSSVVKKCGAHEICDYSDNLETKLKEGYSSDQFDVILDCVGSFQTYRACPAFLKTQGSYVNVGASSLDASRLLGSTVSLVKEVAQTILLPAFLGGTPRKYVMAGLDVKNMPKLSEYVASGKVKPWTDSKFAFDDAPKAYEHLIKGRALGKIVVQVVDE